MAVELRVRPLLVVDDNAATRYATSHVLRAAGYETLTAASGFEAIELALRAIPQLVVLDINLPDMDGFQICRHLRGHEVMRRVPIVYLSATFVDDIDKVQGIDAGADGYLTHPVEPPVLLATVRALLRASRAEDAVAASEARFKAVFDNALNGIALLSDDLVLLDVNPAMCHIMGRDRGALVGRHLSAFSPREPHVTLEAIGVALRDEGSWRGSAPLLNAKGEHVELEWSVSQYAVPDVRLAVVTDITARMAVEADRERLLASERLARAEAEDANRLKDEFLAALSHELRTPLNAIVGFSRLLQRSPVVAGDPGTLSHVNAIERNAWVQAQLISDLLDISRITSGKLELDRQSVRAADAVEAALAVIQPAARAKKVTIHAHLDSTMDPIWWDPSRFQQVVWNLVENAVKFSAPGGTVEVRLVETAGSVELIVKDFGRGITAEFLPHVFDRFRQEDSTSRRGHGGLGLGLAIVHQLVTAHGGTITASSAGEGLGTTFVVVLPRTHTATEFRPPANPVKAMPDLRGICVLVVDDNDDARSLLRQALGEASARVIEVASVKAALETIPSLEPDLLVSDLAMPGEDGFDLIRQVRAMGWSAERLPAIALSAFARDTDRQRALNSGYQVHVGKPADPVELLSHAAALLQARGPQSSATAD